MAEFLQAYGAWIVFGLFFLLMMRMHGGGHGMDHGDTDRTESKPDTAGKRTDQVTAGKPSNGRSGGHH